MHKVSTKPRARQIAVGHSRTGGRPCSALPLKDDCQVVMWQLFAGVTCKQRDPGGGGEGRGAGSTTSPPPPSPPRRCRAGSWRRRRRRRRQLRLRRWRLVPTRTPTSGPMREAGRAAVPPGGWTVAGVTTRTRWFDLGHLGVSLLEALVGCLAPVLSGG